MIARLWNKVPGEEQKLILGAVAAILASGAIHYTPESRYGLTVATGVLGTALVRYFTDVIMRLTGSPNVPQVPPQPPAAPNQ